MTQYYLKTLRKALTAVSMLVLTACVHGSMRVDVEVYDGPLSKTLDVQVAELIGTNQLTFEVMRIMVRELHLSQCRLGCFGSGLDGATDARRLCSAPIASTNGKGYEDISSSLSMRYADDGLSGTAQLENARRIFPPFVLETLYPYYFPEQRKRDGQFVYKLRDRANIEKTLAIATNFEEQVVNLRNDIVVESAKPTPDDIKIGLLTEQSDQLEKEANELKADLALRPATDVETALEIAQQLKDIADNLSEDEDGKYKRRLEKSVDKIRKSASKRQIENLEGKYRGRWQWPLSEKKSYMLTSEEDTIHQVCPALNDVKANIANILAANNLAELEYFSKQVDDNDIQKGFKNDDNKDFLMSSYDFLEPENTPLHARTPADTQKLITYAQKTAQFARILREGAEHWATTQSTILLESRRARIAITRASIAAAELGNELSGRADAVIRQLDGQTKSDILRQQIATSAYLREAEGTDYLNLPDWLEAYPPRPGDTWSQEDRTRMLERLITDANWSKVNTVFAQGAGNTAKVLVKDDIGNWNLKSYENDPTEVLETFTDLGVQAASLVGSAVAPGSGQIAATLRNLRETADALPEINKVQAYTLGVGSTGKGKFNNANTRLAGRVQGIYEDAKKLNTDLHDRINTDRENILPGLEADEAAKKETRDRALGDLKEAAGQVAVTGAEKVKADNELAANPGDAELIAKQLQAKASNDAAVSAYESKSEELETTQAAFYAAKAAHDAAKAKITAMEAELATLPKTAIAQISELLNNQDDVLETLSEMENQ